MASHISRQIQNEAQKGEIPRYRLICSTIIGQNLGQGVSFISRAVWNAKTDNFASISVKRDAYFVVCTVHGVFQE